MHRGASVTCPIQQHKFAITYRVDVHIGKLNSNDCSFSDSAPITLKFASKVGDILTTLPKTMRDSGDADDDGQESKVLPFGTISDCDLERVKHRFRPIVPCDMDLHST